MWAILFLLHHPELQTKLHKELEEVVISSLPGMMDGKKDLTYTKAVIIIYAGIPHSTSKSLNIDGYIIHQGTTVLANVCYVMPFLVGKRVGIGWRNNSSFSSPHCFRTFPSPFLQMANWQAMIFCRKTDLQHPTILSDMSHHTQLFSIAGTVGQIIKENDFLWLFILKILDCDLLSWINILFSSLIHFLLVKS